MECHDGFRGPSAGSVYAWFLAVVLLSGRAEAQIASPELRHVSWPLLDMVVLPDYSNGVWLLLDPTPATREWAAGTSLVSLTLDPVLTLQWVTFARGLTGAEGGHPTPNAIRRLTPPLRAKRGPQFVVLAENTAKAPPQESFVLVVSDSDSHTRWKTFAPSAQVDTLLSALEAVAMKSRMMAAPPDTIPDAEGPVDTPVSIVTIPEPEYPRELASQGRIGRVWTTYVVGVDGRAEEGSFRTLLSDDPRFTRAGIQALLRGKYKPARLKGHPVRQRVFQVIKFRLR